MIFKVHKLSCFAIFLMIKCVILLNLNKDGEVNNFLLDLLKMYYIVSSRNA